LIKFALFRLFRAIYGLFLAVITPVFPCEIILEFPAKAAILELRQSSGVSCFQDSRASEFGENSKAAAFCVAE